MSHQSPVNPIPLAALVVVGLIAAIEAVFALADQGWLGGPTGIGWRTSAIQAYAFAPYYWTETFVLGRADLGDVSRFVSYAVLHGSTTQAIWAVVLLLALGKFVGEIFHPLAFLALLVAGTIGGAFVYGALSPQNIALVGAFPAIYALIGAYTYVLWLRLGAMGENQLKAFRLIGVLLALLLIWSLMFGTSPTWIADLSGFATGLALSPFLAPGGWSAFVTRLRQRGD